MGKDGMDDHNDMQKLREQSRRKEQEDPHLAAGTGCYPIYTCLAVNQWALLLSRHMKYCVLRQY